MKIDEAANHKQGSHITDERVSGWVPAFSIMGLDHNDVVCVGEGGDCWSFAALMAHTKCL